jgi:hypothetical protein
MTLSEFSGFIAEAQLLSPRDPDVANNVDLAGSIAGWLGGPAFASGVAERPALLEYVPAGWQSIRHRGVHGGVRPGEMRVPLCVAGV